MTELQRLIYSVEETLKVGSDIEMDSELLEEPPVYLDEVETLNEHLRVALKILKEFE
jgi:uncharacterized protein YggL (DUF469 family)